VHVPAPAGAGQTCGVYFDTAVQHTTVVACSKADLHHGCGLQ
jgi:hypothetical protein